MRHIHHIHLHRHRLSHLRHLRHRTHPWSFFIFEETVPSSEDDESDLFDQYSRFYGGTDPNDTGAERQGFPERWGKDRWLDNTVGTKFTLTGFGFPVEDQNEANKVRAELSKKLDLYYHECENLCYAMEDCEYGVWLNSEPRRSLDEQSTRQRVDDYYQGTERVPIGNTGYKRFEATPKPGQYKGGATVQSRVYGYGWTSYSAKNFNDAVNYESGTSYDKISYLKYYATNNGDTEYLTPTKVNNLGLIDTKACAIIQEPPLNNQNSARAYSYTQTTFGRGMCALYKKFVYQTANVERFGRAQSDFDANTNIGTMDRELSCMLGTYTHFAKRKPMIEELTKKNLPFPTIPTIPTI